MTDSIRITDYASLLLANTPLIDVRAPIEFTTGALPGATNLPLMNNLERHEVGIMYKAHGQEAAIRLGHQLVSGKVKEVRIQSWLDFAKSHPNAIIYCFRGGLRSRTTQQWLSEAGLNLPVIEGGYKAVRRFLIDSIDEILPHLKFQIVGGPTGSGKTSYIQKQNHFIDLEKIANHRGSAFGGFADSLQPSQVNFENLLALEILRLKQITAPIYVESESRMIGRCALPENFYKKMLESPRQDLDMSVEERVENIFREYILESPLGLKKDADHFKNLENSLRGISRKLGGVRYQELLNDLNVSRSQFSETGSLDSNKIWIQKLLLWYYDPLYQNAKTRFQSTPK
jgi:tRNA 2-selenouridine synthase